MTQLGKILGYVPVNPRYAKMLLLARQKRVLGYILLGIAGLTVE